MLRNSGLELAEVRAEPRGVVLEPVSPGRFFSDWIQTADKRVDCCPPLFQEQGALERCETLCAELEQEDPHQLKLINLRTPAMHNSWYHNVSGLKRPGRLENPLHLSPEDAERLGIGEGDRVCCRSASGELEARVSVDETLRPGVVAMTHGWGNQQTPGMQVASRHPGVNANRLLPSGPDSFERLSNQAFMTRIPVSLDRIAE